MNPWAIPAMVIVAVGVVMGLWAMVADRLDRARGDLPDPGGHVEITEAPYDWAEELTDEECDRILEWVRNPEEQP